MKKRKLDVGKKLKLSYAALIFLLLTVSLAGIWAVDQTNAYTEKMYNHPLQVRRAIAILEIQVDNIRLSLRDIVLTDNSEEADNLRKDIVLRKETAKQALQILEERYLGSAEDISELKKAYLIWEDELDQTMALINQGEKDAGIRSMLQNGALRTLKNQLSEKLKVVDDFAKNKANQLSADSVSAERFTYSAMAILILLSVLLAAAISRYIYWSINAPLTEMQSTMKNISHGKLDTRAKIIQDDEFGEISNVLNDMLDKIETDQDIDEKASGIINQLLSSELIEEFFSKVLLSILGHTKSELGAVYLSSTDQNTFEIEVSIGMSEKGRASFNIKNLEGDLGRSVASRKIERFTMTTEDERFQHPIPYGEIFPKEIITIPIFDNDKALAIITIASINGFHPTAVSLIENIYPVLTTRVIGVLSNNRIIQMRDELEYKNDELKQQQSKLQLQTAEIEQQKTELEKQNEKLSEVSRLKTSFLSNMSHELRTPLNSVIALSGVLSRKLADQIPKEEYSYLEIIERNGRNLLTLINDILDISRIEAGREEVDVNKFIANDSIDEVIAMIQPQADQQNIELQYESEEAIIIRSDVHKFRHILQNLIGNAVKFTEKGRVTVSSQRSENNIIVKVIDTGIGIAEEHLPYIFDEFRQADGSTSRRFGGTGLGLAISKKYANLLGGTISVKSTLNKGSEFTLSLPLQYAAENGMKEQEVTESNQPEMKRSLVLGDHDFSEKTLLLVEDNESAIIQIRDLVEDIGFRLKIAHNAGEAFTIIDQIIPDAMILDLMMPDVDGFKVLEILRNAEPTAHIPVLILTAKHITKDELKFLKRNNIHQLIQKGDVKRLELQNAVTNMLYPQKVKNEKLPPKPQVIIGKPVVLVVEDNPDNMITVKVLLEDHHTVLEAVNAHECIELAKEHLPNLILMDIALPDISGIEAFQQIKKISQLQDIPVIALTASAMTNDREAILSHGFDAYIPKPIMGKEFFKVIQEVLYGK